MDGSGETAGSVLARISRSYLLYGNITAMGRTRDNRVLITWRLAPAALAEVDELASERGETRSDTLRVMLSYALQHKPKLPAPVRPVV